MAALHMRSISLRIWRDRSAPMPGRPDISSLIHLYSPILSHEFSFRISSLICSGFIKGPDRNALNYSTCREVLDPWLLKVLHFSGRRTSAEESRLASARSRVSMSNRRLKRLRCGWSSPKCPGLTGTDPEGVSELGEDSINLLAGN